MGKFSGSRSAAVCRSVVVFLLMIGAAAASELRGVVTDARTQAPLAQVHVLVAGTKLAAMTDAAGSFEIASIPAGHLMLQTEGAGYRIASVELTLAADEAKDVTIELAPLVIRRNEHVEVNATATELSPADSAAARNLTPNEVRELGTVIANDPFRAVQALPGVSASGNNDFFGQFSVYGAGFEHVGVYMDGVLLHQPFHTIPGMRDGASVSAISSESVQAMELEPIAFGARYGDRTGAALDLQTRDGSRERTLAGANVGLAESSATAEGPLSALDHLFQGGSWMVLARKSYMKYLTHAVTSDPTLDLGLYDAESKVTLDLTSRQKLTLHVLDAHSDLDRSAYANAITVNSAMTGDNGLQFASAKWSAAATSSLLLEATGAYMRDDWRSSNPLAAPLGADRYREWSGAASASWSWRPTRTLDAGWSVRRMADDGYAELYPTRFGARLFDAGNGTAVHQTGYVQQSWALAGGRARVTGGLRWDKLDALRPQAITPHAALALALRKSTTLHLGWGNYAQFPDLHTLVIPAGGRGLLPERATHYVAAIEQRVGEQLRVRVEAYDREERDGIARPLFDPRLVNGRPTFLSLNPYYFGTLPAGTPPARFANSLRGYARGIQFMVQRRSANRLTGWASYTLGYARQRDLTLGEAFASSEDQRHTVNVFGSYRLTPTVSVSAKWAYGSGFPVEGYYQQIGSAYFLAATRNELRLPPFQRLDARVNKDFHIGRVQATFYGEVLNVTNRQNRRWTGITSVNIATGVANLLFDRTVPVLPTAGLKFEF